MRIGRMDRRIRIEQPAETRDDLGSVEVSWVELASVWARKVPNSAATKVIGIELVSEQSVLWSIRYRADVTSLCRVVHSGDVYRIDGVYEGQGRLEETFILSTREEPERAER